MFVRVRICKLHAFIETATKRNLLPIRQGAGVDAV